ncbi:unnamed protein product [Lampetra planeri]
MHLPSPVEQQPGDRSTVSKSQCSSTALAGWGKASSSSSLPRRDSGGGRLVGSFGIAPSPARGCRGGGRDDPRLASSSSQAKPRHPPPPPVALPPAWGEFPHRAVVRTSAYAGPHALRRALVAISCDLSSLSFVSTELATKGKETSGQDGLSGVAPGGRGVSRGAASHHIPHRSSSSDSSGSTGGGMRPRGPAATATPVG